MRARAAGRYRAFGIGVRGALGQRRRRIACMFPADAWGGSVGYWGMEGDLQPQRLEVFGGGGESPSWGDKRRGGHLRVGLTGGARVGPQHPSLSCFSFLLFFPFPFFLLFFLLFSLFLSFFPLFPLPRRVPGGRLGRLTGYPEAAVGGRKGWAARRAYPEGRGAGPQSVPAGAHGAAREGYPEELRSVPGGGWWAHAPGCQPSPGSTAGSPRRRGLHAGMFPCG